MLLRKKAPTRRLPFNLWGWGSSKIKYMSVWSGLHTEKRKIKWTLPLVRDHLNGCYSPQFNIDKPRFLELLLEARRKIFITKNVISGFRAIGILPFDPT